MQLPHLSFINIQSFPASGSHFRYLKKTSCVVNFRLHFRRFRDWQEPDTSMGVVNGFNILSAGFYLGTFPQPASHVGRNKTLSGEAHEKLMPSEFE